ncbi:MAG: HpaII family restriction endonuclease [Bacteroidales bacterium]|nr:HpaII family restriction endonuclease [Bacteroidales bacterium]
MALSGNKGEWSEVYAFFKLIVDKVLYAGDADLNRIEGLEYPIIEVMRQEGEKQIHYALDGDSVKISDGVVDSTVNQDVFLTNCNQLFDNIKSNSGAFTLPEIEAFMDSINCHSIKASSSNKTDINVMARDLKTNFVNNLGFSIKSQLGSPSTLVNASKATNFTFKIEFDSISDGQIKEINGQRLFKDKFLLIHKFGGKIKGHQADNNTFRNNLIMIDSYLPEIFAEMLYLFYSNSESKISDIGTKLTELNPVGYDLSGNHLFYEYKIKHFLTDYALGMMASRVWNGEYESTGGYLIVKEEGDLVCYHIINKNLFEKYLYYNTKFETASTEKHEFGTLFKEGNDYFIKLNLQIRFLH